MIGAIVSFDGSVRYAVAGFVIAALFAGAAVVSIRLPPTLVAAHFLAVGVLVSIAFAVLTSGPALLVALAVQAAATAVLARMMRDLLLTLFAALLALIALVWAALSMLNGWFEPLDGGRHIANLIVVAMVVAVAAYGWYRRSVSLAGPMTVLGWVLALVWLASVLAHVTQGQVAISFLWAVAAAAALIHGVGRDLQLARVLGITTLVVVLAKLLTVDLAAVDTLWRVGLFLVVGAGLLRLGYILPRLPTSEDSQLR